jgi:hypothetical protein
VNLVISFVPHVDSVRVKYMTGLEYTSAGKKKGQILSAQGTLNVETSNEICGRHQLKQQEQARNGMANICSSRNDCAWVGKTGCDGGIQRVVEKSREGGVQQRRRRNRERDGLTSLRVEEHERLVQRLRVLVGRRRRRALVRDELDDHHDEADEDAEAEDGADGPHEDLAVDDDAAQVDVPLLLLARLVAGPGQEPALLRLVQLPHQRRPVQVPAPVVICRRVGVGDLQRPAPGVPPEHPAGGSPASPPPCAWCRSLAAAPSPPSPGSGTGGGNASSWRVGGDGCTTRVSCGLGEGQAGGWARRVSLWEIAALQDSSAARHGVVWGVVRVEVCRCSAALCFVVACDGVKGRGQVVGALLSSARSHTHSSRL